MTVELSASLTHSVKEVWMMFWHNLALTAQLINGNERNIQNMEKTRQLVVKIPKQEWSQQTSNICSGGWKGLSQLTRWWQNNQVKQKLSYYVHSSIWCQHDSRLKICSIPSISNLHYLIFKIATQQNIEALFSSTEYAVFMFSIFTKVSLNYTKSWATYCLFSYKEVLKFSWSPLQKQKAFLR